MRKKRDFQISIRFRGRKRRDFLSSLSLLFSNSSLSRQSGLSFPQNSLSVSLACESLLSVFTHTQVDDDVNDDIKELLLDVNRYTE